MQKKLFVGGLSYNTDVEELRELFIQAGEVMSVNVIKDKFTNQSRGFGFVEMANKEDGERAIAELNGKEINGRELKVNEAKPQESRGGGGRGGYGGGGGRDRGRGGYDSGGGGGGYGGNRW